MSSGTPATLDTVKGGDGTDTMPFNGSGGNENFEVSADGGRTLLTRNLGNIVMDFDDIEKITINALGGADKTIVTISAALTCRK